MKSALSFSVIILLLSIQAHAQHPLIGTWRLMSIRGVNADGKPFYLDSTKVKETKIFTATHYMLIAEDIRGDSAVFNRCYAGTVRFDGNKFVEVPFQASIPIFDGVKTDFTWSVKGDVFTQSGTIIRPDGRKVTLEALQFKKVKSAKTFPNNPSIGAWTLKSATTVDFNGETRHFNPATGAMFQLVTPTHWMRISHENGKFEEAVGGSYEIVNDKTVVQVSIGFTRAKGKIDLDDHVAGNQLHIKGKTTSGNGKVLSWEEVFDRAQAIN